MSTESELKEQIRINKALKKHLKDAAKTIDMISDDLQQAKQQIESLKQSVRDAGKCINDWNLKYNKLEASLPKLRADAFIDGATWDRESRFHKDIEIEAEAYANQLEQGNE